MNRKAIGVLLLLCTMALAGCLQKSDRHVTVRGAVNKMGVSDLYVTYTAPDHHLAHDTIRSTSSGKFDLHVKTCEGLSTITIYFAGKKCWTTLYAEPGDRVTIRGNLEYVDLLTVRGGKVNDDLNRFKARIRTLYKERINLLKGNYSKDNLDEVRLAEINLLLKREAKDFIRENPSSVASAVLIRDFFYQELDPSTAELLGILTGQARICPLADEIRAGLKK